MKKDGVSDPQSHEATKTWKDGLMPTYEWRSKVWRDMIDRIEGYIARVHQARVTPTLDPEKVRALLYPIDFDRQTDPLSAIDFVATGLWKYQVHTPHPRYFGLFNPAPAPMGIVADALVAAFNPQLASWSRAYHQGELVRKPSPIPPGLSGRQKLLPGQHLQFAVSRTRFSPDSS